MSDGYIERGSVFWNIEREQLLLVGGGAAILLQVAHPLVAQGVADHSDFRSRPLERLIATVRTIRQLVFGTRARADRAREWLRRRHVPVSGRLELETPRLAKGTSYRAHDPELLYWVHATLIHVSLRTWEEIMGPLAAPDRDAFYAGARMLAELLDVPADRVPETAAEFDDDFAARATQLCVTPNAQAIAGTVLDPPLWWLPRGVVSRASLATRALLPPAVRSAYALEWTQADACAWHRLCDQLRRLHRWTPSPLRYANLGWGRVA